MKIVSIVAILLIPIIVSNNINAMEHVINHAAKTKLTGVLNDVPEEN